MTELAPGSCRSSSIGSEQDLLETSGWVRRTIADRTRMDQLVEVYQSLGFETRVLTLAPDRFGDACRACAVASAGDCLLLFTRRPAPPPGA